MMLLYARDRQSYGFTSNNKNNSNFHTYFIENNKSGTNKSNGFIIFLLGNKNYIINEKNTHACIMRVSFVHEIAYTDMSSKIPEILVTVSGPRNSEPALCSCPVEQSTIYVTRVGLWVDTQEMTSSDWVSWLYSYG